MPESEVEEICVVGAGLMGLSAVAYLMKNIKEHGDPKKKYKITLIEKRKIASLEDQGSDPEKQINPDEDFNRSQKIISDLNFYNSSWNAMCLELFDPSNVYSISGEKLVRKDSNEYGKKERPLTHREQIIQRILRTPADIRGLHSLSIKSIQKALAEYIKDPNNKSDNMEIVLKDDTSISAIEYGDNQKSTCTIQTGTNTPEKINFNSLLICEGENREIINKKLNPALKAQGEREIQFNSFPHTNEFYCVIRLKFKDRPDWSQQPKRLDIKLLQDEFEWEKDSEPEYALNTNLRFGIKKDRYPFGFSCEIPEKIFNMPHGSEEEKKAREQAIINWSLHLAAHAYGTSVDNLEFDPIGGDLTEKQRISAFSPDRQYSDQALIEHPDGDRTMLFGDCIRSPFHPRGVSALGEMIRVKDGTRAIITGSDIQEIRRKHNLFVKHEACSIQADIAGVKDDPFSPKPATSEIEINLIDAVRAGDLVRVSDLLRQGADPNIVNPSDDTEVPLYIAISSGNLEIADALLKNGADPNLRPFPLEIAIKNGNLNAINMLLLYGCDPDYVKDIVNIALTSNNKDIITILIFGGVNSYKLLSELKNRSTDNSNPMVTHIERIKELKYNFERTQSSISVESVRERPSKYYIAARENAYSQLRSMCESIDLLEIFKSSQLEDTLNNISEKFKEITVKNKCIDYLDSLMSTLYIYNNGIDEVKEGFEKAYKQIPTTNNFEQILEDFRNHCNSSTLSTRSKEKLNNRIDEILNEITPKKPVQSEIDTSVTGKKDQERAESPELPELQPLKEKDHTENPKKTEQVRSFNPFKKLKDQFFKIVREETDLPESDGLDLSKNNKSDSFKKLKDQFFKIVREETDLPESEELSKEDKSKTLQ
ncbi:Ankyrin repeats (3 copies) [Legionella steigerwaltii]|uniref:Ankyrin repeats (3 copies) n=1 Tax=Legionella steigerwaltii TaxID=460 RepID=A0A378LCB5_9GAMM|nr:ankyrin repeat domain-containing protein [Legionella steigerwaltii]KTD79618.1 Ankyrin repeats (3 copies) [Legionella steigerwaltii]STY24496.1 Ankyrin repeats (3 copies) [Legionella steigerwaltii]